MNRNKWVSCKDKIPKELRSLEIKDSEKFINIADLKGVKTWKMYSR